MDPDPFTNSLFKWDPRASLAAAAPPPPQPAARLLEVSAGLPPSLPSYLTRGLLGIRDCPGIQGSVGLTCGGGGGGATAGGGLEELFHPYAIRYGIIRCVFFI